MGSFRERILRRFDGEEEHVRNETEVSKKQIDSRKSEFSSSVFPCIPRSAARLGSAGAMLSRFLLDMSIYEEGRDKE